MGRVGGGRRATAGRAVAWRTGERDAGEIRRARGRSSDVRGTGIGSPQGPAQGAALGARPLARAHRGGARHRGLHRATRAAAGARADDQRRHAAGTVGRPHLRRLRPAGRDRRLPGGGATATTPTSDDSTRHGCAAWASHDALLADLKDGVEVPDVFLASRSDLAWLRDQKITQPVDDLLDERGVDFGDDYSRDALQAYSVDNRLQCMPYGISPMVIYYNKRARRLRPDAQAAGSTSPGRRAAARCAGTSTSSRTPRPFATRPARRTRGRLRRPHAARPRAVHLLRRRLALRRRRSSPTSLALSDGDSRAALERTLQPAARPAAHAHRETARAGDPAGVVRARPARHDRGLPLAGARAAAGARAWSST